jgi:hypothetical protein
MKLIPQANCDKKTKPVATMYEHICKDKSKMNRITTGAMSRLQQTTKPIATQTPTVPPDHGALDRGVGVGVHDLVAEPG